MQIRLFPVLSIIMTFISCSNAPEVPLDAIEEAIEYLDESDKLQGCWSFIGNHKEIEKIEIDSSGKLLDSTAQCLCFINEEFYNISYPFYIEEYGSFELI